MMLIVIRTAALSLSHLLDCLSRFLSLFLSVTFLSIETLFELFIESKNQVVSARQQAFACTMHKALEKVTLREGSVEIHTV